MLVLGRGHTCQTETADVDTLVVPRKSAGVATHLHVDSASAASPPPSPPLTSSVGTTDGLSEHDVPFRAPSDAVASQAQVGLTVPLHRCLAQQYSRQDQSFLNAEIAHLCHR